MSDSAHPPLFAIEDISYAYDDSTVICDLSLRLGRGKFFGIVGPNGCGKTTFLDLLIGNKTPGKGRVIFQKKPINSYSRHDLAQQISLVPQEFDTGFGYTVEEIVLMGRHPYIKRFASPAGTDWDLVDKAMKTIGIDDLKDRYTNELSGGQKQRTIVARALAQETPVILFDEATSSLDVKYTLQIFNVAKKLIEEEGKTVIAVIHNLNLAAAYCDEIIFMKDGQIHSHGSTPEVMNPETIRDVFGVETDVSVDLFNQKLQVSFMYQEDQR